MRIDRRKRFLRRYKRLTPTQRKLVEDAVALFLSDCSAARLDFKQRVNSRYHSIRVGTNADNLRIAMLKIDEDFYAFEFIGNHDDLNSLDRQDR